MVHLPISSCVIAEQSECDCISKYKFKFFEFSTLVLVTFLKINKGSVSAQS
jgi:hypothetical protein